MKKGRTAKKKFGDSGWIIYTLNQKSWGARAKAARLFLIVRGHYNKKCTFQNGQNAEKRARRARGAPKRAPEHGPKNLGYVSSSKKNIGLIR